MNISAFTRVFDESAAEPVWRIAIGAGNIVP
jgi:hypothetical protein